METGLKREKMRSSSSLY